MHSAENQLLLSQWEASSRQLEREFMLRADDLPSSHGIRSLFLEIADGCTLSQEAVNALMYGLYFYGYLCALEALRRDDPGLELPDNLGSHPVILAADRWAQGAPDADLLGQMAVPVIKVTQELLEVLT